MNVTKTIFSVGVNQQSVLRSETMIVKPMSLAVQALHIE